MDDRTRHEVSRGKILKILAPEYPNSVDLVLLRRLLDDFGTAVTERTLESYVAYLHERGYVNTDTRRSGIALVSITAKGLDLVDGRIDDTGVEVDY